ncbi:uncharacterized protein VTP21DRAFT_634 [Calcarisporiella thermophila]|uniref:uncharacterized protein n=1 Tax=Calcarisporiella thermophila TaxID=911321 RepID=UPI003741FCE1
MSHNDFPSYVWPELDIGAGSLGMATLEYAGGSHEFRFLNDEKNCWPVHPRSSMKRLFPRSRAYPPSSMPYPTFRTTPKKATQKFKSSHPDLGIPEGLLTEYLKEGLETQQLEERSPFNGNLLAIGGFGDASVGFAAFPMGEANLSLNVSRLVLDEECADKRTFYFHPTPHSTHHFRTPIRQIASLAEERTDRSAGPWPLLVRTMGAVNFFKVEDDRYIDGFNVKLVESMGREDFAGESWPVHVALSPYGGWGAADAAIMARDGHLYFWRNEFKGDRFELVRPPDAIAPFDDAIDTWDDARSWMTCEFGRHPLCLYRAHQKGVDLIDLRTRDVATLMKLDTDPLCALRRIPVPYSNQFVVATEKRLSIYDQRYNARPLLSWSHFNAFTRGGLELVAYENEQETQVTILGWSKEVPLITAHQYLHSANPDSANILHPPFSCGDRIALPFFREHPYFASCPNPMEYIPPGMHVRQYSYNPLPPLGGIASIKGRLAVARERKRSVGEGLMEIDEEKSESQFTLMQLAEDGSVYAQTFGFGVQNEPSDGTGTLRADEDFMMPEELQAIEAKVTQETWRVANEMEVKQNRIIDFRPGLSIISQYLRRGNHPNFSPDWEHVSPQEKDALVADATHKVALRAVAFLRAHGTPLSLHDLATPNIAPESTPDLDSCPSDLTATMEGTLTTAFRPKINLSLLDEESPFYKEVEMCDWTLLRELLREISEEESEEFVFEALEIPVFGVFWGLPRPPPEEMEGLGGDQGIKKILRALERIYPPPNEEVLEEINEEFQHRDIAMGGEESATWEGESDKDSDQGSIELGIAPDLDKERRHRLLFSNEDRVIRARRVALHTLARDIFLSSRILFRRRKTRAERDGFVPASQISPEETWQLEANEELFTHLAPGGEMNIEEELIRHFKIDLGEDGEEENEEALFVRRRAPRSEEEDSEPSSPELLGLTASDSPTLTPRYLSPSPPPPSDPSLAFLTPNIIQDEGNVSQSSREKPSAAPDPTTLQLARAWKIGEDPDPSVFDVFFEQIAKLSGNEHYVRRSRGIKEEDTIIYEEDMEDEPEAALPEVMSSQVIPASQPLNEGRYGGAKSPASSRKKKEKAVSFLIDEETYPSSPMFLTQQPIPREEIWKDTMEIPEGDWGSTQVSASQPLPSTSAATPKKKKKKRQSVQGF